MPEEENIYVLYDSGTKLLDKMRSCGMGTVNRNKMLDKAFDKEDLGALKTVIGLLRENLAAYPGGPAAAEPAVPSPPVHDVPAPAPRATQLQQCIQFLNCSNLANDEDAA